MLHFLGVGNPIKSDDSVGLYLVSKLRKTCGRKPNEFVTIHPPLLYSRAEFYLAKIGQKGEYAVIFDAVDANSEPGRIIFGDLSNTQYGFFSSHNIPLKLIPELNPSTVYILGIQPQNIEVGEELSRIVLSSANEVLEKIPSLLKEGY